MSACAVPGLWLKKDKVSQWFDMAYAVFFQMGPVFQGSLQIKYFLVLAVTVPFSSLLVQIVQSMAELRITLWWSTLRRGDLLLMFPQCPAFQCSDKDLYCILQARLAFNRIIEVFLTSYSQSGAPDWYLECGEFCDYSRKSRQNELCWCIFSSGGGGGGREGIIFWVVHLRVAESFPYLWQ